MAKTKTLDQLRAEKEQAEAQLLQEQHKLQRLEQMILSILVDTFISKISFPMQPGPEIGSISDA